MTLHIESMNGSVEYRQQQVAHDIAAARRSDALLRTRVRTGLLLIRLGERLGQKGECVERAMQASRPARPRPAAA